jgi:hypothetical protein
LRNCSGNGEAGNASKRMSGSPGIETIPPIVLADVEVQLLEVLLARFDLGYGPRGGEATERFLPLAAHSRASSAMVIARSTYSRSDVRSRPHAGRSRAARQTTRDFERAQFISLKGDFLSEHDVSRGKVVSGHKAPTRDWMAVLVQFDNVRRRAMFYQIAPSTVATNHLEVPVPVVLGALLYRQPISQKSMTSPLGFIDVAGAEPTPKGE